LTQQEECPNCGSKEIIKDPETGERICAECGIVLSEDALDRGPEWRAFTPQERESKQRTGTPISNIFYDQSLSIDALHLPRRIKEQAIEIYRQALKEDLIRGQTIDGFVAASIYAACRQAKIPRSLKEVAELSTQDIKTVSRIYRQILRELDIRMPIDYPMKFVPRIANLIKVKPTTDQLTVEILKRAHKEKTLAGKDPRGMAAAALYLACKHNNEECTQKEISDAAGITEVTLRNRLRDLEELFQEKDLEIIRNNILRTKS
jgi:transcription initiation factor TFIIB